MTQPLAYPAPLPLALTYTPDASMDPAVRALVARLDYTHGSGGPSPFGRAMDALLTWLVTHPDAVEGRVALTLDYRDDTLIGDVRWDASAPPQLPELPIDAPELTVACDVEGSGVRCRVSCACP